MKPFQIELPESICLALNLPSEGVESRLKTELAIRLYHKGILSLEKAGELSSMDEKAFMALLVNENIPLHQNHSEVKWDFLRTAY